MQSSSNYPAPQDEFGFEINDNQGGGQVEEAADEPDDMSNLRATDEPAQGHVFDDDGVLPPHNVVLDSFNMPHQVEVKVNGAKLTLRAHKVFQSVKARDK